MDQTVNLTSSTSVVRIHLCPPQRTQIEPLRFGFFVMHGVSQRTPYYRWFARGASANGGYKEDETRRRDDALRGGVKYTSAHHKEPKSNHFDLGSLLCTGCRNEPRIIGGSREERPQMAVIRIFCNAVSICRLVCNTVFKAVFSLFNFACKSIRPCTITLRLFSSLN